MKIQQIRIENYLGIEEIDVILNKDKVFIEGGNGKGKTSVLEAIENALNSTSDRRPKKVREGEEKSILLVKLDDGTEIKRTIDQDGSNKVDVKKDGIKVKSPETFLKNLFGGFTFNPVDFLQKKDKEQAEILLNMIPFFITEELAKEWFKEVPSVDYKQHGLKVLQELAEKYFFSKRAVANLEVKELNNQIEALTVQLPPNYNYKVWESVSLSEKYKVLEEKRTANRKIIVCNDFITDYPNKEQSIKDKYSVKINELNSEKEVKISEVQEKIKEVLQEKEIKIFALEKRKKDIISQIAELNNQISCCDLDIERTQNEIEVIKLNSKESEEKAINAEYTEKQNSLKVLEEKEIQEQKDLLEKSNNFIIKNEVQNIDLLVTETEEIEKMKGFIALDQNREVARTSLVSKEKTAEHYNQLVEFCRNKPKEIISQMKLPIEGLGIDADGNITINSIPIKNLSTAEQLDLAIDIARTTAGELKVICIDKFESLDTEAQERFMKKTEDDGFVYCITRVSSGDLTIG